MIERAGLTAGGSRGRIRRQDFLSCAVLVLLWIAVWLPRFSGPIDLRWDASVYYILGTSLAEGKGYRLLNEPGEIEAVQYPPLLPLIVAAHERALGTTDYLMVAPRLRHLYFLLSGLYLVATYVLSRAFLTPLCALVVSCLTALSCYNYLPLSDTLYSDMPFALVSVLFLICHRQSHRTGYAVATGLLGAAAYLLRTAGVALLAAWVGESLIRRRFRQAAIRGAIAAVPVLLWQTHIWHVTAAEDYRRPAYPYQRAAYYYSNVSYSENSRLVDPFRPELGRTSLSDFPKRVLSNLGAVPAALGQSCWVPPTAPDWFREKVHSGLGLKLPPNEIFAAVPVLLGWGIIVGAVLFAWRGEWFLPLYFAVTVGLVSLTPWPENLWRYLAALTPVPALFLVHALLVIGARLGKWDKGWGRAASSFVIVAPLAIMPLVSFATTAAALLFHRLPVSYYDARGNELPSRLLGYGPEWRALDPTFEWLRHHAGPDDVIASTVPHLAYLRTGHRAVLPPMEADAELARRLLDSVPVTYVVLDQFGRPGISERYATPAVQGRPSEWRLVYTAPGGGAHVYERVR